MWWRRFPMWWRRFPMWWRRFPMWWRRFPMWWRRFSMWLAPVPDVVAPVPDVVAPGLSFGFFGCWPGALPPVPDVVAPGSSFGFFAAGGTLLVAVIAVRGGTAGTGIGDGDRAPAHQQARCEHANSCSEAQTQQTHHHLLPTRQWTDRQRTTVCHIVT